MVISFLPFHSISMEIVSWVAMPFSLTPSFTLSLSLSFSHMNQQLCFPPMHLLMFKMSLQMKIEKLEGRRNKEREREIEKKEIRKEGKREKERETKGWKKLRR